MVKTLLAVSLLLFLAILMTNQQKESRAPGVSFGDELAFLARHTNTVVLRDPTGNAQVVVAPAWQGRVMTSTARGAAGASFGFVNRPLIAAGKPEPHMTTYGGEDRFWLGPEGGQFSIFFPKGARFVYDDWQTPAAIDTMAYDVVGQSADAVALEAAFSLTNYSGTKLDVKVHREVRLLAPTAAWQQLSVGQASGLPGSDASRLPLSDASPLSVGQASRLPLSLVAFESDNRITNAGREPWRKETGLLSVWILGMYNPAPQTTIVVPIVPGTTQALGTKVTSDYFGEVPPDRLVVGDRTLFFKGDGLFRSKIGVNPRRSRGVLGSYDAAGGVLTIVQFTQPPGVTDYVNSQWKLQDDPYGGDALNSYNDGPAAPGAKPLGPFYELESSSPAAALAPGSSLAHIHRTFHLVGDDKALDPIARAVLGVSLAEIRAAFRPLQETAK